MDDETKQREFKIGEEVRVKGLIRGSGLDEHTPVGFLDVFIEPIVIRLPEGLVFKNLVNDLAYYLMKDWQEEFGKGEDPGAGESAIEIAIRLLVRYKKEAKE